VGIIGCFTSIAALRDSIDEGDVIHYYSIEENILIFLKGMEFCFIDKENYAVSGDKSYFPIN
jgi:hypothetical protein